jgi:hypothetical protein
VDGGRLGDVDHRDVEELPAAIAAVITGSVLQFMTPIAGVRGSLMAVISARPIALSGDRSVSGSLRVPGSVVHGLSERRPNCSEVVAVVTPTGRLVVGIARLRPSSAAASPDSVCGKR